MRRLPFFMHPTVCRAFVEVLAEVRREMAVRWIGFVIMPEHVHLLAAPLLGPSGDVVRISQVLESVKGESGKRCKQALREIWRTRRSLGRRDLDRWAVGGKTRRFWKPRGHDFNIVSSGKLLQKLEYIHQNPVRRRLVDYPAAWPWSSFRFYECRDASPIAMDWDGSFPVIT